jgi:hypothetical protein
MLLSRYVTIFTIVFTNSAARKKASNSKKVTSVNLYAFTIFLRWTVFTVNATRLMLILIYPVPSLWWALASKGGWGRKSGKRSTEQRFRFSFAERKIAIVLQEISTVMIKGYER